MTTRISATSSNTAGSELFLRVRRWPKSIERIKMFGLKIETTPSKISIMNPVLLRRILMWVAPLAIGYLMKKYEARRAKKAQQKSATK